MAHHFPVEFMINTVQGPSPLTPERATIPLPQGYGTAAPRLHYGPYLASIASFLARDNHGPLREGLSARLQKPVAIEDIRAVEIVSVKHGACYHVLRVRTTLPGGVCSLAVNVAANDRQTAALEREFQTVRELHDRFNLPFLPQYYLLGETSYGSGDESPMFLGVLVGEWFDDHHEFHLSGPQDGTVPQIKLWERDEEGDFLNAEEARSLYHQASSILTAYLDERSFRQVHPWHHAAGDFVVRRDAAGIHVRLITARDTRCLCAAGPGHVDMWVPILHFLLNLSVRMRMDRLDGTGPLAWAPPDCLSGVVSGFLAAWRQKTSRDATLPEPGDLVELAGHLSVEEWTSFAECVIEDCVVESEEEAFVRERLRDHVLSLTEAIRRIDQHFP